MQYLAVSFVMFLHHIFTEVPFLMIGYVMNAKLQHGENTKKNKNARSKNARDEKRKSVGKN